MIRNFPPNHKLSLTRLVMTDSPNLYLKFQLKIQYSEMAVYLESPIHNLFEEINALDARGMATGLNIALSLEISVEILASDVDKLVTGPANAIEEGGCGEIHFKSLQNR